MQPSPAPFVGMFLPQQRQCADALHDFVFAPIINETLIAEAISDLSNEQAVTVRGPKGKPKRSEKILPTDIVFPCSQEFFQFFKRSPKS
jgi:hypothetical protein